ncbi:EAL domain-containing protein [Vibrio harveyi]|uniref:EAL domain-containing protein n=1 Tax=Vibrio harveyi TaxID=669 RepID=UPI0024801FE7|nr:EAL domain-containing protein [Vibrio harveyi]
MTHLEIFSALESNEFYPYYQPIVNTKTHSIHSYEILARWKRSDKKVVMPLEFLRVAENYSINHLVTLAVLTKALNDNAKTPITLNVNLSPNEFLVPTLFESLEELIEGYNYPKSKITLELTEGECVGGWKELKNKVHYAVGTGWRCSLDDYGVKNQTLQRLTELPVCQFKLDRSLLPEITGIQDHTAKKKCEFIRSLSNLSNNLGIEFVIEGVENSTQASFLNSLGVSLHQGYFYSKPLPIEETLQFPFQLVSA